MRCNLDGFTPWLDLVHVGNHYGPVGLVIEAFRDGYVLYIPGLGLEHLPFERRLIGHDRVRAGLQDDAVGRARRCYSLEKEARCHPDLAVHASAFRETWTRLLDQGLGGHYSTIRRQLEEQGLRGQSKPIRKATPFPA